MDRERGAAFVGAAVLAVFVVLTGVPTDSHGSLVGWPLFLLVISAAGLAIGLRPRQPLPPPPGPATATPIVPIRTPIVPIRTPIVPIRSDDDK